MKDRYLVKIYLKSKKLPLKLYFNSLDAIKKLYDIVNFSKEYVIYEYYFVIKKVDIKYIFFKIL